jgi:hypothetical protein
MSEHTEGKWTYTEEMLNNTLYYDVVSNDEYIAHVHYGNEANARLIAAAPEMYDLLKINRDTNGFTFKQIEEVYELIKQIEGDQ